MQIENFLKIRVFMKINTNEKLLCCFACTEYDIKYS